MFIEYNPNPVGRRVGDCSIRAVSKALDTDWETAYALTVLNGFQMGDMPSSDAVWGSVLRQNGFKKSTCEDCPTAEEFGKHHDKGIYVLGFGGHVATMIDGDLYDSWNSSDEVPIYYWYKEE